MDPIRLEDENGNLLSSTTVVTGKRRIPDLSTISRSALEGDERRGPYGQALPGMTVTPDTEVRKKITLNDIKNAVIENPAKTALAVGGTGAAILGAPLTIPAAAVLGMAAEGIDKSRPFSPEGTSDYLIKTPVENAVDIGSAGAWSVIGDVGLKAATGGAARFNRMADDALERANRVNSIGRGYAEAEYIPDLRNIGNFVPSTDGRMATGVLYPRMIPAPIDANLPEGTMVGNPLRNRVPGTPEGRAYDEATIGVPLEANGEPPKFFRGGPTRYDPKTLSGYDENGAFVFGAKDRDVSLSYVDDIDKTDMKQKVSRALLHNEPLANGVTRDELKATLNKLSLPGEMSEGLQDAYATVVRAGLHNPPRPQMQEFYMLGKNVKNIPHNEQYIDWRALDEGENLLENGFDAIIHRNVRDPANHIIPGSTLPTDVLQTNKQNLAKSIYNEGTWNLSNPNIYKVLPFAGLGALGLSGANSRQ